MHDWSYMFNTDGQHNKQKISCEMSLRAAWIFHHAGSPTRTVKKVKQEIDNFHLQVCMTQILQGHSFSKKTCSRARPVVKEYLKWHHAVPAYALIHAIAAKENMSSHAREEIFFVRKGTSILYTAAYSSSYEVNLPRNF